MHRCENQYIKKSGFWRTDALEFWRIQSFGLKFWCWRRLLRILWTSRRSNHSILKEINPEYSLEVLNAEAEAPILWPLVVKSMLIGKDPDAGKDWRQKNKGVAEDEMVGWHHGLNGHECEQTLGGSEQQESLVNCSSWAHKELDTT